MQKTLARAGIPAKEIKVFGSSILITCWSRGAADRYATVLRRFCTIVRGPIESTDYNHDNRNTVLKPTTHAVWRVGGAMGG